MRAAYAFAPERFAVVHVARWKFAPLYKEHFHTQKHYGYGQNRACEQEGFHRFAEILCKYMKGSGFYAKKEGCFRPFALAKSPSFL